MKFKELICNGPNGMWILGEVNSGYLPFRGVSVCCLWSLKTIVRVSGLGPS